MQHDLLPAFGISATTTVIKRIRLGKLPRDAFLGACLMEWAEPRTTKTGAEGHNTLTIAVESVDAALRIARDKLGLAVEPPVRRVYPVLGEALVGTCYVSGGGRVEFVRWAPTP